MDSHEAFAPRNANEAKLLSYYATNTNALFANTYSKATKSDLYIIEFKTVRKYGVILENGMILTIQTIFETTKDFEEEMVKAIDAKYRERAVQTALRHRVSHEDVSSLPGLQTDMDNEVRGLSVDALDSLMHYIQLFATQLDFGRIHHDGLQRYIHMTNVTAHKHAKTINTVMKHDNERAAHLLYSLPLSTKFYAGEGIGNVPILLLPYDTVSQCMLGFTNYSAFALTPTGIRELYHVSRNSIKECIARMEDFLPNSGYANEFSYFAYALYKTTTLSEQEYRSLEQKLTRNIVDLARKK